jgi:PiT family inorganic phosphate transporter
MAVFIAAVFEIAGAMTGTAVALTIGTGVVAFNAIPLSTVLAALLATMSWSMLTYYFGIPVSETHGLIGGIVGAAVATAGSGVILWFGLIAVLAAIIISPLLGFAGGFVLMKIVHFFSHYRNARKMDRVFKNAQRFSTVFMAFSHGRNDAQKPMGILVMALAIYYGWQNPSVPVWVIISMGFVAGAGVAYGGWRIVKTLGFKVTKLGSEQGFAAETSAGIVMQLASAAAIPVSTTLTITASIFGAGVAKRFSSVRWGLAVDIGVSWVLTLPVTILLGFLFANVLGLFFQA